MRRSKSSMYFTYGTLIAKDKIILSGHLHAWETDNLNERMTRIVMLDHGKWDVLGDLPEIVSSLICVEEDNSRVVYILLRNGVLHKYVDGEDSVEVIDENAATFFFSIRKIGAHLYACGNGISNRIFRRKAQKWVPIENNIWTGDKYKSLYSIDGHSEDDIYTVGTGGIVFHYDGYEWLQLDSPATGGQKVKCLNGKTYIIGNGGRFFCGDVEGWALLARDEDKNNLTNIEYYDGRFYIASEFRLVTYNEGKGSLEPINIPVKGELAFGALCSGYGQLWSIGDETVLCFDGGEWMRFEFPYNKPRPKNKPGKV